MAGIGRAADRFPSTFERVQRITIRAHDTQSDIALAAFVVLSIDPSRCELSIHVVFVSHLSQDGAPDPKSVERATFAVSGLHAAAQVAWLVCVALARERLRFDPPHA
ncbi:MAG: hypothetical protein WBW74_22500 [Xanthobacteraceae bacterium]